MDETDAQLLGQYRDGDVAALEQLVAKYQRPLFGYIVQITGGRDDPDDVFQEVWLRAIRKEGTYRHGNFLGWLIRIAHNMVIDRGRRRKADWSLNEEDESGRPLETLIASSETGPLSRIADAQVGRRIAEAVATLPVEQRGVFLMRTQMGLPFKEIARVQRVSINTALARMQYALKKLRTLLKEDYDSVCGPA